MSKLQYDEKVYKYLERAERLFQDETFTPAESEDEAKGLALISLIEAAHRLNFHAKYFESSDLARIAHFLTSLACICGKDTSADISLMRVAAMANLHADAAMASALGPDLLLDEVCDMDSQIEESD